MRRFIITFLTLVLILLGLSGCSSSISSSQSDFHLQIYKEGTDYTTDKNNSEKAITAFTNPSGIREKDTSGKYTYLKYAFLLPATIIAEQSPEFITYRSKQDNITISLPINLQKETGSREITLSWEDAKNYAQIWIILELNAQQLASLQANPDRPTELEYCINSFNDSFLEIEATYKNGISCKKQYSIYPGEKGEFGLKYVMISEH